MAEDGTTENPHGLLRMKFEGGRFSAEALPSTTLTEITRLSRIFTALAEDIWKANNKDRKRVPRGFAKRFELFLKDVGGGSTTPVLASRGAIDSEPQLFEAPDAIAETAARRLEEAFISIIRYNDLPEDFPAKAQKDVTTVFSTFSTAEYPSFIGSSGEAFRYTQSVRSKFLNERRGAISSSEGRIAGRIVQLHVDKREASLELIDGRQIGVSFRPGYLEDMRASISDYEEERFAVLECEYQIFGGGVSQVTDVSQIYILALPNTGTGVALRELLTDDPLGEVDAVSPEAAETAAAVARLSDKRGEVLPAVFPAENGAVQLVWRGTGVRRTIEISGPDEIYGRVFNRTTRERWTFTWETLRDLENDLDTFMGGGAE